MYTLFCALAEENSSDIAHSMAASRQKLVFPHISIDGHTRAVEVEGKPVRLTANEFEILYLLACFPDKIISAKEIYRSVWHMEDLGNISPVQVHMSNMRNKLREACPAYEFITTKWKKGYQFIWNEEMEIGNCETHMK